VGFKLPLNLEVSIIIIVNNFLISVRLFGTKNISPNKINTNIFPYFDFNSIEN
jgi:hypothetical protein